MLLFSWLPFEVLSSCSPFHLAPTGGHLIPLLHVVLNHGCFVCVCVWLQKVEKRQKHQINNPAAPPRGLIVNADMIGTGLLRHTCCITNLWIVLQYWGIYLIFKVVTFKVFMNTNTTFSHCSLVVGGRVLVIHFTVDGLLFYKYKQLHDMVLF